MRESDAEKRGVKPRARVVGLTRRARIPSEFSIAPVHAVAGLLEQVGWKASDVDRWEINEAFAVVTMLAMKDQGVARSQVNVHRGACAPLRRIGASDEGALNGLIDSLVETGGKRGIASLCVGGGEAVAIALERM